MFNLSISEILLIGIVGILVFGGKFPQTARNFGIFLRKLQRLFLDIKYDIETKVDQPPQLNPPAPPGSGVVGAPLLTVLRRDDERYQLGLANKESNKNE
ncbi:MAG: twin-arginine translocase TatA/TatE family subunit [Deltaproteobacteria bacterium]|nr:twin-arginine translocase TatA/TatE family subunit [Deltaproteobacteria bacterium]